MDPVAGQLTGTRVVFMGSPEFAVPSLRALVGAGATVVAALSQPDRPSGRGGRVQAPPVKLTAIELGIQVLQPETLRDQTIQAHLRSLQAAVFVVAAYGKILPQVVLDVPRRGCLNVHASLLPRWRGASPITAAILAGDTVTGVSIMELVRKMDAGPVISRVETPVLREDTTGTLEPRLAALGAAELVRILSGWLSGELVASPQDEDAATYCHLISKNDGHLAASMTAEEAERAVRAYNPWPGAFVSYRSERLAIWRARVVPSDSARPGATAVTGRRPAIAFGGGWLVLEEVQRPGGKRLTGEQFLAGEHGTLEPTVGLA
ncbi:MAG: methionyl-tRNA formyltransferase [Chloroflexi bacterium]|nr:methionyl-tRNA formyltransferase [Chloroflexota bacterium]PWB45296.1 MAG: methionyl-tRNA formyltransferase [Dehalococcoidia bacterium]